MTMVTLTKINGFDAKRCYSCASGYRGGQFCGMSVVVDGGKEEILLSPVHVEHRGDTAIIRDQRGRMEKISISRTNMTNAEFKRFIQEVNCCCEEAEAVVLPDVFIGESTGQHYIQNDGDIRFTKWGQAVDYSGFPGLSLGNAFEITGQQNGSAGFRLNQDFTSLSFKGRASYSDNENRVTEVMVMHCLASSITFGTDTLLTTNVAKVVPMGNMEQSKLYEIDFEITSADPQYPNGGFKEGDIIFVGYFNNGQPTVPYDGVSGYHSVQIFGIN